LATGGEKWLQKSRSFRDSLPGFYTHIKEKKGRTTFILAKLELDHQYEEEKRKRKSWAGGGGSKVLDFLKILRGALVLEVQRERNKITGKKSGGFQEKKENL